MTSRNDVLREKSKETTDSQDKENVPPPNRKPVAKEKEVHQTHSFEWRWSHKKQFTKSTCNRTQTIEDCLEKSPQFREVAEKQKDKELVIIRDGKVITSHFPCSLIKNERLILKFVKAVDKPKKQFSGSGYLRPSSKLVMFHVLARGGKNIVMILKNPALRKLREITVYAFKGEKLKQALRRDGRFLNTVFKKNCALSHTNTDVNTEMSNLVDDLDGKTFEIKLLNKSDPPESQPGSLDDYVPLSESPASDAGRNEVLLQQPNTAEPENDNKPEKNLELCGNTAPEIIPGSKQLWNDLDSQLKDSIKGRKTQVPKLSRIQNLLRLEFGSNAQRCQDVKTMKKLMVLSNSVCQVRINGKPRGSGFLLFGRFVLTNAHVIRNDNGWLSEGIAVIFSYESLEQNDGLVDVEEVVGYDYCPGADWALLRLSAEPTLPDGLLIHCGFDCHSGGICIIGHPNGGVKKIDPCLIVSAENRSQAVERHRRDNPEAVQFVTHRFFESRHILTYQCSSYSGSSGSPVFNEDGNVVAVHTAGFPYNSAKGQTQSVIEYGWPFSDIIKRVIIQMVEREKFDVLKEYLACEYVRREDILVGVKKLVECKNLTAFKNAVNNSEAVDDKSLKAFFKFFSPEPMETD
ncbi:protein FAM111A-like [Archocentrus centrarchus]|uniref:protein FAM111A-like n=1 Tax=Archocentrus centrarchus TaxID=63155 RepID=UPI0011E9E0E3|nr:protein FAM111A-like [Archocentrus centrarchus]